MANRTLFRPIWQASFSKKLKGARVSITDNSWRSPKVKLTFSGLTNFLFLPTSSPKTVETQSCRSRRAQSLLRLLSFSNCSMIHIVKRKKCVAANWGWVLCGGVLTVIVKSFLRINAERKIDIFYSKLANIVVFWLLAGLGFDHLHSNWMQLKRKSPHAFITSKERKQAESGGSFICHRPDTFLILWAGT